MERSQAPAVLTSLLESPAAPDILRESPARPGTAPAAKRNLRVLLIDDNVTALRLTQRLLAGFGVEALTATNAEAAITIARVEPLDALFVDLRMSPVNGIEVLRQTAGMVPRRFVLTGYADPAEEREALALGADAVLHKPMDVEHMLRLVNGPTG